MVDSIIVPILWKEKLRHRVVRCLILGSIAYR